MPSKSRIAVHIVGACLTVAGLGAVAIPAVAIPAVAAPTTTRATTPVCSAPRPDGNYICITLDSATSPSTVTGTVYDEPNGRGWTGQVEIDGPAGPFALSTKQGLGKGGTYVFSVPANGNGQYCAIDWLWYIYDNDFVVQDRECVTAS